MSEAKNLSDIDRLQTDDALVRVGQALSLRDVR